MCIGRQRQRDAGESAVPQGFKPASGHKKTANAVLKGLEIAPRQAEKASARPAPGTGALKNGCNHYEPPQTEEKEGSPNGEAFPIAAFEKPPREQPHERHVANALSL